MFKIDDFKEDYLIFDHDFIIESGNQIILGANGIGKSSIYRSISILHPEYDFIDYDQLRNDFIKNKNKLLIGTKLAELEAKSNEKSRMLEKLNINKNIKSLGIKAQKDATAVMSELKDVYVDDEKALKEFNSEKLQIINSLQNGDKKFLVTNFVELNEIHSLEDEVKHLKDEYMNLIYIKLDEILENDDCICPICGTVNDIPIKEMINEKKNQLSKVQNDLLSDYQKQCINCTPEEVVEKFESILHSITENNLCKKDIISFYVCGGESNIAEEIQNTKPKIEKLDEKIRLLEQEKERYYQVLKENEDVIKNVFSSKFEVSTQKIVFNNTNKIIEITLPRVVEKYSTGEINLMVFTFNLYQFIASDKEVVIVDDPLSSYDISNQYKIMFDLVDATTKGKKVVILSHNIDCINIANSQHRGVFTYKYIEKLNNTLYLKDISLNKGDSVLKINSLLSYVDNDNNKDKYFKLLIERESDLHAQENKIFHYDEEFSFNYQGVTLTNEYFITLIDNLKNNLHSDNFENNAIEKILYLTAIRVWIEKQFYLNNPSDNSLKGKKFGEKLEYVFPRNGQKRWNGSIKVTKEYLMSKKTMINQHCHYKSQILPFNYALNITLDELKNEILDIISHFQVHEIPDIEKEAQPA